MNTYEQDTFIPIYMTLQYENYMMKFPINPEVLKKEIPSDSTTVEVEGIGEVSVPSSPKLATININSFFWQAKNLLPSAMYIAWLEKWQKSKKPANFIVTRLNYSMQVTCEHFSHWINAGEESDIYYELRLREYRSYGAKKLNVITDKSLFDKLKSIKEDLVLPVLVEIPRPQRNNILKIKWKNPYTVLLNENLQTITKRITGYTTDWKALYDENAEEIGNLMIENKPLRVGMKLVLPQKWVENSAYNIESL